MDIQATTLSPLSILLAEDNALNQIVILRMLAKCGYQADVAGNGREVLRTLEQRAYHVILMDVHMPELSGLQATEQIRQQQPANKQPYIIAMTGNLVDGDAEVCLGAGMNAYINKPVRMTELTDALRQATDFLSKRT